MQMANGVFNVGKFGWAAIACPDHFARLPKRDVQGLAPISQTELNSIDNDPTISRSITGLSLTGRPMTVGGLVIPIIVSSIKRKFLGRSFPHIRKKVLKAGVPTLAYLNASSSITVKFWVVGIITSLFHTRPNPPLRFLTFAMKARTGKCIGPENNGCCLTSETATAKRCFSDISGGGDCGTSAITLTFPHGISRARRDYFAQHHKSSMSLALKVKSFRHSISPILILQNQNGVIGKESQW